MPDVNIDFDSVAEFYDGYVHCDIDLDFWRNVARATRSPRLELMCGTGRIALAILRDGEAIEGLDYSAGLLDVFRAKLARAGLATTLYHDDARRFDLPQHYGLIFIGFHAIAEVIYDSDKLDVFCNVRRHLAADGEFWMSIHNPPQRRVGLDGVSRPIATCHLADTGEDLHVVGEYQLDENTGIATGRQIYRCSVGGAETRCVTLPVRFHLIAPERLDELLAAAGLIVTRRLGTYTGEEFDPTKSPVYIARCQSG